MNKYKRLFSDTVFYGVPSILGRVLFALLSKLYTNEAVLSQEDNGKMGVLFSLAAFLLVVFGYGLETAFFRFALKEKDSLQKSVSTALYSSLITTAVFGGCCLFFSNEITRSLNLVGHNSIVQLVLLIVALDTLTSIPFAYLRAINRPIRFALIKLAGIILSIGLNIFFYYICPRVIHLGESHFAYSFINSIYNPNFGVAYVFIANVLQSLFMFLLLLPVLKNLKYGLDKTLLKKMVLYGLPIMLVTFGSIVNEVADRILLKWFLKGEQSVIDSQIGIYNANYKLSIFLALFTQAFRYAGEPFFFSRARDKDAKKTYANVFHFFTIFSLVGFVFVSLNLNFLKHVLIESDSYFQGLTIVPTLLMAYVFSGIYYNLSIWYKLSDKTIYGAVVASIGALITILVNSLFIPKYGYWASTMATFLCFFSMSVIAYLWGQKVYPVPYRLLPLFKYFIVSLLIFFMYKLLTKELDDYNLTRLIIQFSLQIVFVLFVYFSEKKSLKQILGRNH